MDAGPQLIIDKIKRDKGLDLSGYKESTLNRRIDRRMRLDGASSLDEYIRMIGKDYQLYNTLISDLFVDVTDFFRDTQICAVIRNKVLPGIIERKFEEKLRLPLRIWSAGCSTGEETYTLAIMLRDIFDKKNIKGLPAFVHGTDIMEDKLDFAKIGLYPKEKVETIDKRLVKNYFISQQEGYKLHPIIKIMTRFKEMDLAQPSVFLGFDMIVCRNVLIYFQRKLQDKVIEHFYKALRPNGILWLGKAESLSRKTEMLFEPVYRKERIFRKRQMI